MKKLPVSLFGKSRRAESLVRDVLLVGFLTLLVLVAILGYWSYQSFAQLEESISGIRQAEVIHHTDASRVSETAGKIEATAQTVLANRDQSIESIAARRSLNALKSEMDARIGEAKRSATRGAAEWAELEAAFNAYWQKVSSPQPGDWFDDKQRLTAAIDSLTNIGLAERDENDRQISELGRQARRKETTSTLLVLGVSALVAFLTLVEIRRNLARLGTAYSESSTSRDYLRSLLDSLHSGVVVIAEDGTVETIGKSFRKLTCLPDAEVGQSYEVAFAPSEDLCAVVAQALSVPERRNRYQGRLEIEGGKLLDVFTSPLVIGTAHRGLILVLVDVTEEVRAQGELQRNRALSAVGQMTAQIAHEIKNPLGSIRFAAEILKRQGGDGGETEAIGVIERSVDHLAMIVSELSDYARPRELRRTPLSLHQLLDEVLPMVADRLQEKEMRIEKRYEPQLPAGEFDVTELRKLFLNLIINAIEASEKGKSIELRTLSDGNGGVVVQIIDQGSGMDAETLRRLFEPFYTTKEKGTGLGMAIARKIAELHNGELDVKSRKGQGTTATVRLPLG